MTSFIDLAKRRVSVRRYESTPVPEEDIVRILETGRHAPSGNNAQPWRFIVVQDEGIRKKLCSVAGNQDWMSAAPVTIAVVADPTAKIKEDKKLDYSSLDERQRSTLLVKAVRDAAIAADHIVMAATDIGYGTCWVAMYEQEDIRPVLDVPDHCFVVALITVGKAAALPRPSRRYPLEELTFDERYGRRTSICHR